MPRRRTVPDPAADRALDRDWSVCEADEAVAAQGTDAEQGLTREEADRRRALHIPHRGRQTRGFSLGHGIGIVQSSQSIECGNRTHIAIVRPALSTHQLSNARSPEHRDIAAPTRGSGVDVRSCSPATS